MVKTQFAKIIFRTLRIDDKGDRKPVKIGHTVNAASKSEIRTTKKVFTKELHDYKRRDVVTKLAAMIKCLKKKTENCTKPLDGIKTIRMMMLYFINISVSTSKQIRLEN